MQQRPAAQIPPHQRLILSPLVDESGFTVLRGRHAQAPAGPLLVVFCAMATAPDRPSFLRITARMTRPVLFVMDHQQTWFATPEAVACICSHIAREMDLLAQDRIDTLGFSMGAFAAIAFAERLPVRHVVAFAPRYSPDPAIAPDRRDRPSLRTKSGQLALATLEAGMAAVEAGVILHGMRGPDRQQIRHIRVPAAVDHWLIPFSGHTVAHWLNRRGRLEPIIRAGLAGDSFGVAQGLWGTGAARQGSLRGALNLLPFQLYDWLKRR